MLKILVLLFICILGGVAPEEYNAFKNCSQIPFCSKLRNVNLDDSLMYSADINHVDELDHVVFVPLSNKNGDNLYLNITFLKGSMIRIEIGEPDNNRFKLLDGWALADTPKTNPANINFPKEDSVRVSSGNCSVTIIKGPPFRAEVYLGTQLELVLRGDKMIMENTNDSQAYAFQVEFESAEKLYGLFDHSYKLALGETADESSEPFRMKNVDASAFIPYPADSTMSLYGAVSAVYGHSANVTSGVFLHNGAEQWIDISYSEKRPSAYFMVESAALDLFLLLGPTPKDIVRQFTNLTGKYNLPQLWTLGYHQCRMSYHSQEDVKNVVAQMQKHRIPMDAIWLARDHTDDNRWFKWNATAFSDPVEMMTNISALNKKCVPISDPHFKIDDNYEVYKQAKENHYFVKLPNGDDFEGICWPGMSSWIDFFMPSAAKFYGDWYHYDKWQNTTPVLAGIWNDMNEPAVFNGTETTARNDLVFRIDDEGTYTVSIRDVHNLYGLMHVKATFQGLLERDYYQKRPFILTRSHFAGSQRYTAMWTGDNSDTWQHFANSWSQCMTGNLLGMPMCGPDVGGFFGNTSHELAQRWFQGGAWLPFYRAHSNSVASRREPYLYPEEVRDVIRRAIQVRYAHIPYYYTLFYQHSLTGDPVIRPLFYHYPGVQEHDTQMLVGRDVMPVAVVNESVTEVEVYLPGENEVWYRVDSPKGVVYSGGKSEKVPVNIETSPIFYRGGGIIPIRDIPRLSTEDYNMEDPFTLVICYDNNGSASGNLYLDDYNSFEYQGGSYYYMSIEANHGHLSITIDGDIQKFKPIFEYIEIIKPEITHEGIMAKRTRISKTKEGRLLKDIDFGYEARNSVNGEFVFHY